MKNSQDVYQDIYNFRTLRVYLYYRLILSALLYLMYEAKLTSNVFGLIHPELFRWASLAYLAISIFSLALLLDPKVFSSNRKIAILLATDLGALVLLIHSSGGVTSGLGYLLIIVTAIASMFLRQRLSLAFAAVISILLLCEAIFSSSQTEFLKRLFAAGSLGFLIFLTAVAFQFLTERIQASTLEAIEKSAYARQLVQLAEHIVTRMRTGIIVVNDRNHIELVNDSALQLLDVAREHAAFGKDITTISNLSSLIDQWRSNPVTGLARVHELKAGKEVRVNFASLKSEERDLTILYLEDYATLIQQAHQLKLASLGRLTASIAHEVRNPLGAISHAAQLLSESEKIDENDAKFTAIILRHCARVNSIVENTMSLSKRKEPKAEHIVMSEWIPQFIEEFKTTRQCKISCNISRKQPPVKVDPSHLRQILTNLFENGLRYSMEATKEASIEVLSGTSKHDETSYIEVIDNGPGVAADKEQTIFEPFFTTGHEGTGLGLYISRELCEINQATLRFQRSNNNKSCFRINFPHHQRMI